MPQEHWRCWWERLRRRAVLSGLSELTDPNVGYFLPMEDSVEGRLDIYLDLYHTRSRTSSNHRRPMVSLAGLFWISLEALFR